MSAPTSTIRSLPVEVFQYTAGFLDPQSVGRVVAVCREWRDNLEVERTAAYQQHLEAEQRRIEIEAPYLPELVQVFAAAQRRIAQLPVLDLGERGGADHIDFLTPRDMSHPVMRFSTPRGRVGLALIVRAELPQHMVQDGVAGQDFVLTIHKRFREPGSEWAFSFDRDRMVWEALQRHVRRGEHRQESLLGEDPPMFHIERGNCCPFNDVTRRVNPQFLRTLLNGGETLGFQLGVVPPAADPNGPAAGAGVPER